MGRRTRAFYTIRGSLLGALGRLEIGWAGAVHVSPASYLLLHVFQSLLVPMLTPCTVLCLCAVGNLNPVELKTFVVYDWVNRIIGFLSAQWSTAYGRISNWILGSLEVPGVVKCA